VITRFFERRIDVRFLSWLSQFSNPWRLVAFKMVPKARTVRSSNPGSDAELFVPYGEGGTALGITGFVMGLDGKAHTLERDRLLPILQAARQGFPPAGEGFPPAGEELPHQRGLDAIDQLLATGLPAGNPFDVKVILEMGIAAWASSLFGVPTEFQSLPTTPGGSLEEEVLTANLMQIGRAVMSRTLFNVTLLKSFDPSLAVQDKAIVGLFRERLADPPPPPAGCVHALLLESDAETGNQRATNDMIGLIGGATELMLESALSILDWALASSKNWSSAHSEATGAPTPANFVDSVARLMAIAPPQYFLIRQGNPGATEGQDLTLVGLWDRNKSLSTPASETDAVFGIAPHRCLGRSLALDGLAHLLHPIFLHASAKASPRYKPSAPPINLPTWITLGPYRRNPEVIATSGTSTSPGSPSSAGQGQL
jgi:hypothetical protein